MSSENGNQQADERSCSGTGVISEADLTAGPSRRAYPDQPCAAVGAVVFRDNCVLLVRRGQAPSSGLWAIPGGRVELGETLSQAAEREIFEETGVRVRAGHPVYIFDHIEKDSSGRIRFHYVITDLLAEYVSGSPQSGDDADEARWISTDEFDQMPVSPQTRHLLSSIMKWKPL